MFVVTATVGTVKLPPEAGNSFAAVDASAVGIWYTAVEAGNAVPLTATGVGSVGIVNARSVSGISVNSGLGSKNTPGLHLTSNRIEPPPDNPLKVPPSNSPLFDPVGNVPGTVEERVPRVE